MCANNDLFIPRSKDQLSSVSVIHFFSFEPPEFGVKSCNILWLILSLFPAHFYIKTWRCCREKSLFGHSWERRFQVEDTPGWFDLLKHFHKSTSVDHHQNLESLSLQLLHQQGLEFWEKCNCIKLLKIMKKMNNWHKNGNNNGVVSIILACSKLGLHC